MAAQPKTTKSGDGAATTTTIPTSPKAKGGPGAATILNKIHGRAPNSTQLIGFFTLLISGSILLLLTGLTVTATVLALIVLTPVILLTSPIWVPVGTLSLLAVTGFLSTCGLVVAALAGGSWTYKYIRGRHPSGSERVNYARSRIANHIKDSAKEYGGHLQSRVNDAAPGA